MRSWRWSLCLCLCLGGCHLHFGLHVHPARSPEEEPQADDNYQSIEEIWNDAQTHAWNALVEEAARTVTESEGSNSDCDNSGSDSSGMEN